MTNRIEKIKTLLTAALSPSVLRITDDSDKHRGHPGAASGAGHFSVEIAASAFQQKTKLDCHRLIYSALAEMMPTDIHALQIKIIHAGDK